MFKTIVYFLLSLNLFFLAPVLVFGETPGSWRGKETHGLGFGIEGAGVGFFYDFAINSTFQTHFFGSGLTQYSSSLGGDTFTTSTSISGLSLRIFPSDNSKFFLGFGGGGISINQTVYQSTYCYSYSRSLNPSECSGYEGSTISKQTVSEFSGTVGFGELGWQGYEGYYFTIGARGGSVSKSSEVDNTDDVMDISNHKITAKNQWENAKTASGLILSFAWRF